jgi:hypothetical protein
MTNVKWRAVDNVDHGRLREARLQAHYAVQWLARVARAYVPPQPHDGHTNLGWDDALDGFTTHPLTDGTRLGLTLADLTLAFLPAGGGAPLDVLHLNGHADADVHAWLGPHLTAKGLDARALDAPSPYEMPAHPIATGARYAAADLADALSELAAWYANANGALGRVRQHLIARKFSVPPVRCWPHHFDLDCLLSLPAGRSVGAGFSPGDHYYEEPYFYVSAYPGPAAAALPKLPLGHWHTQDFTGAVATASDIVAAPDPKAATDTFLQVAADGAIKVLG